MAGKDHVTVSSTDTPEQIESASKVFASRVPGKAQADAATESIQADAQPEADEGAELVESPEDAEDTATEEPSEESDDASAEQAAKPETPPVKTTGKLTAAQRRAKIQNEINELTREKYKTQGELEALQRQREQLFAQPPQPRPGQPQPPYGAAPQAPPEPAAEPQQKDFDSWEEYDTAWRQWMVKSRDEMVAAKVDTQLQQRLAQEHQVRAQQQQQHEFGGLVENLKTTTAEAKERHADYDDVVSNNSDLPVNSFMQEAIMRSSMGGELMYALCTRPDDCARIAQLPPQASLYELGKLEAEIAASLGTATSGNGSPRSGQPATTSSGSVPRRPMSRASKPIQPLAPGASATTPKLDEMPYDDYKRARLNQLRGR